MVITFPPPKELLSTQNNPDSEGGECKDCGLPSGTFPSVWGRNNSQSYYDEAKIVLLAKSLRRGARTKSPGPGASSHGPLLLESQRPAILTGSSLEQAMGDVGPCSGDRASMRWSWLDFAIYPWMSWPRGNIICHLKQEPISRMGSDSLCFPLWTAVTKRSTFKRQLIKLPFWPSF